MRLARFEVDGVAQVGLADAEGFVPVGNSWCELLETAVGHRSDLRPRGRTVPFEACRPLIPLDESCRGVFCIGLNYSEHATEVGDELGSSQVGRPPIFMKAASALLANRSDIVLDDRVSKQFDWEVELGVVIGRGGRHIPQERVADHIVGYTVVVDTTARDLQRDHGQWFIGKNVEASSPIGPWIVTSDEVGYPPAVELSLQINGVDKQRSTTDKMIWSISEFISMTSAVVELRPGDIFATGSPDGVGFRREPPEFLSPGDCITATIDRVGTLENRVR